MLGRQPPARTERTLGVESAQGATEYILLLVAVVALVLIFKDKITEQVRALVEKLGGDINKF